MTGDSSVPNLDADVLLRLERELGGRRDRVVEVLSIYLQEIDPYLSVLRQAFDDGNAELMEFSAHRLGSASVLVGANRLTGLCRELESLKGAGDGSRSGTLVARIQAEAGSVQAAIREFVASGPIADSR